MFGNSRFRMLVLAAVVGLGAGGIAMYYLAKVTEAANPMERVVVAKMNIPARTPVTEDMLTTKSIAAGARHPEAVREMRVVVGKTSKQGITAGEQVLTSKFFSDRATSGLAFVIPEGKRALAVETDEHIGAGGLIAAGDRVDIIGHCSVQDRVTQGTITKAMFTLQNIEVLAVAQKIVGEEPAQPPDLVRGNSSNPLATQRQASRETKARTATLALAPKEAQAVVLLEENSACGLRLALRASGDTEAVNFPETSFNPAQGMPGQPQ